MRFEPSPNQARRKARTLLSFLPFCFFTADDVDTEEDEPNPRGGEADLRDEEVSSFGSVDSGDDDLIDLFTRSFFRFTICFVCLGVSFKLICSLDPFSDSRFDSTIVETSTSGSCDCSIITSGSIGGGAFRSDMKLSSFSDDSVQPYADSMARW
ncbi:hypothetical protein L1887_04336 [Cichorium endivia]|nr:hypothetical protein L1887_04336 [Cichorium endivia]